MNFFEQLLAPITSEKLEKKGQHFYKAGKVCLFAGAIGLGLFILSIIGTMLVGSPAWINNLLAFEIDPGFEFMNPNMALSYLGILAGIVGSVLYFNGMKYFALGRIASNTEKE